MSLNAFVSWSGGKDSALSLHRAAGDGHRICALVSMLDENGRRSRAHGLSKDVLQAQASSLGIALVTGAATWEAYENEFLRVVRPLVAQGINAGIFGDIDLEGHRQWVTRICQTLGITPLLPLWHETRDRLINEFLDLGFEAMIIRVRTDLLSSDWLGQPFDRQFVDTIKARPDIDVNGEQGEYHTLVYNGPGFSLPLSPAPGRTQLADRYAVKDIRLVYKDGAS